MSLAFDNKTIMTKLPSIITSVDIYLDDTFCNSLTGDKNFCDITPGKLSVVCL